MVTHPGKAGALAGWYQQGCSGIIALASFPLISKRLSAADAGIWFSFQSFLSIIILTDFGLSFVMSRQVAYSLHAREGGGLPRADFIGTRSGWPGVNDIYWTCRRIFAWVSLISASLLLAIGFLVLPHGKIGNHLTPVTVAAWMLMGVGTLLSLQTKTDQALIEGLAKIYWTKFISGTCQLLSGIGVVFVLLLGGKMLPMAAVVAGIALFQFFCFRHKVRNFAEMTPTHPVGDHAALIRKFLKVAVPMGVLNLSSFLISSIQVPVLGLFFGPEIVPPFYLAQKIGQMLNLATTQMVSPQLPLFTRELADGRAGLAWARMRRTIALGTFGTFVVNAAFFAGTPWLVQKWLGPGRYVNSEVLLFMSVDYFILGAAVFWAQFVFAAGRNPFVLSTVLNAMCNLTFLGLLCPRFGLAGIPLATLSAGLLTNYWFTPFKGLQLANDLKLVASKP